METAAIGSLFLTLPYLQCVKSMAIALGMLIAISAGADAGEETKDSIEIVK